MNDSSLILEEGAGGPRYFVVGDLTLEQVVPLQKHSRSLWSEQTDLTIDFSRVGRVDSAGLALLIEWTKSIKHKGGEIRFYNLPRQLTAMARVSGLETIFPIFRD